MPEQVPIWRIISMSYVVRIRSRCASSSLPSRSSCSSRTASSASMPAMARSIRSGPAT
jgi:hypothetical protein